MILKTDQLLGSDLAPKPNDSYKWVTVPSTTAVYASEKIARLSQVDRDTLEKHGACIYAELKLANTGYAWVDETHLVTCTVRDDSRQLKWQRPFMEFKA